MDSGYDQVKNYNHVIKEANATPIIAYNKRREYAPPQGFNEEYQPICSMRYPLSYWGREENISSICPRAVGKLECPQGTCCCSDSDYGYCKKIDINDNPRLIYYPLRHFDNFKFHYNFA